jgi:hypothetical protein
VIRIAAAPRRETPKVAEGDLEELMRALPSWELVDSKDMMSKKFVAKNFVAGAPAAPARAIQLAARQPPPCCCCCCCCCCLARTPRLD